MQLIGYALFTRYLKYISGSPRDAKYDSLSLIFAGAPYWNKSLIHITDKDYFNFCVLWCQQITI